MTSTSIDLEQAPLQGVLCDALETLAFISPLPLEGQCPMPSFAPDLPLLVTVRFKGCCAGALQLAAPKAFAEMLASNILAAAPDDPLVANGAGDALKELANVICGAVIRATAGFECASVEMGIPECRPVGGEADWQEFVARAGTLLFDADGHMVAARFYSEPLAE